MIIYCTCRQYIAVGLRTPVHACPLLARRNLVSRIVGVMWGVECSACCSQVVHKFYEQFTGLPLDRVEEETDRDNFMNPKQAKELGLIDDIILSADLPALATAAA